MDERFAEDLTDAQIEIVESWMRPGTSPRSRLGFLASGENLRSVVAKDNVCLRALGVTHDQVAIRLIYLIQAAARTFAEGKSSLEARTISIDNWRKKFLYPYATLGLDFNSDEDRNEWKRKVLAGEDGRGILIEGRYEFFRAEYSGWQACPFGLKDETPDDGSCGVGYRDFIVRNVASQQAIFFPELIVHLIKCHHFFEGTTPYRLDPASAIRILDVLRANE